MKYLWSYAVWALWLLLFLALELPGNFRLVPWVTLSETSWHLEAAAWPVRALFFGFLIGLVTHIVFHGGFWKTQAFGLVIALGAHFVNRHWP